MSNIDIKEPEWLKEQYAPLDSSTSPNGNGPLDMNEGAEKATPHTKEKKGVDLTLLVSQVISKNDASQVYALAPGLSRVSTVEYEGYRTQLKEHFKQRINLSGLDQAVREVRKKRKLAQRAHQKQQPQKRPTVEVGGQMRDVVQRALDALVLMNKKEPLLFVQAGRLVTIHFTEDQAPSPLVTELSEHRLRHLMSLSADYISVRVTTEDVVEDDVDPPLDIVRIILNGINPVDYPFPALVGVTELPIMRSGGSIHATPGYDPVSRYVYIPGNLVVPDVPDKPTEEDVQQALALLEHMLADFPFTDQASKAAIIAMMITVVIRMVIDGQVPLTLLDAPKQGTGKTLLALIVGIIATGRLVPINGPTDNEEEMGKKVLTWLLQSPSVVVMDNVVHRLESSNLNSTLTAPYREDRELGSQKLLRVANRAVWFAAGNNISVGDDTARRCIKCRLDARMERPWLRKQDEFQIRNILQWTQQHRGELVAAILTLARYWYVQGCPAPDITPLGSFEEWTTTVGGILQAVGVPDFLANLNDANGESDIDEVAMQWKAFTEAFYAIGGETPITASELASHMLGDTEQSRALCDTLPGSKLAEKLDRYRKSQGSERDFPVFLGNTLRTRKDQVYGVLRLQQTGKDRTGKVLWQVVSLKKPDPLVGVAQEAPLIPEPQEQSNGHHQEPLSLYDRAYTLLQPRPDERYIVPMPDGTEQRMSGAEFLVYLKTSIPTYPEHCQFLIEELEKIAKKEAHHAT